jgi:hypothetical protein
MSPIPTLQALGVYLALVLSLIGIVLLFLAVIDRIVRWLRPSARIQPEQERRLRLISSIDRKQVL